MGYLMFWGGGLPRGFGLALVLLMAAALAGPAAPGTPLEGLAPLMGVLGLKLWTLAVSVALLAQPGHVVPAHARLPWFVLLALGGFLSVVAAQVYRYRWVASALQRQQIKWVVAGFVAALGSFFALLALVVPRTQGADPGSVLAHLEVETAFLWNKKSSEFSTALFHTLPP